MKGLTPEVLIWKSLYFSFISTFWFRCRHGWQGEFCNECIPAEGCQHGTCSEPFECNCDLHWGGRHCEINLNACGAEPSPCLNESKCENLYGNFTCTCLPGYSGNIKHFKEDTKFTFPWFQVIGAKMWLMPASKIPVKTMQLVTLLAMMVTNVSVSKDGPVQIVILILMNVPMIHA